MTDNHNPARQTKAEIQWIEWTGGDFLPVPPEMRVTVLLRDGSIEGPAPAREFGGDESCWKHRGAAGDIVAYTSDLLFAAPPQEHLRVTDEMVEKAAAAYWLEVYGRHRKSQQWPDDVHGGSQQLFRDGCRAALNTALSAMGEQS